MDPTDAVLVKFLVELVDHIPEEETRPSIVLPAVLLMLKDRLGMPLTEEQQVLAAAFRDWSPSGIISDFTWATRLRREDSKPTTPQPLH